MYNQLKQKYSSLKLQSLKLFGPLKEYRKTVSLSLGSSSLNFQLNEIEYENILSLVGKPKPSIGYKSCSNISKFSISKRLPSGYLWREYGLSLKANIFQHDEIAKLNSYSKPFMSYEVYTTYHPEYDKYSETAKAKVFIKWKKINKLHEEWMSQFEWVLENWDNLGMGVFAYQKISYLDYILYTESQHFDKWVRNQQLLSQNNCKDHLTKSKLLQISSDLQKEIYPSCNTYNDLENSRLLPQLYDRSNWDYFNNFHYKLNHNPYLWISALNKWNPTYLYKSSSKIHKSLLDLMYMIRTNHSKDPLSSQWIESPKGKYRLLCIPNFTYRWLCRMWNDALSLWVLPKIHPNFHGFICGRGVMSWWKMFLENRMYNYDYIFEFDMASFFPNVNKKSALEALLFFDVPLPYAIHLINLVSGEIKPSTSYPNSESFYEETLNEDYRHTNRNLPMGNALCPLISSLVLYKHFLDLGLNYNDDIIVTGYADDNSLMLTTKGYDQLKRKLGVNELTSEILSEYISNSYKGILVEPAKSGFVKFNGIFQKAYKNLGLVYDNNDLYASTRGTNHPSSKLKLEFKSKFRMKSLNLTSMLLESKMGEYTFMDRYFGMLLSILFNDNTKYEQDFTLSDLEDNSFGMHVIKKYELEYDANIQNLTSLCNSYIMRFYLFHKFNLPTYQPLTETSIDWKEGNDQLYFKKYKDLSKEINHIPFIKTYGFHLWNLNKDYMI